MPPLNISMVEVHQELAKTTHVAKEIAEVSKRTTKAPDLMYTEWSTTQKTNEELSARLQQVEAKLKEADEHLQTCDYVGIPHVPDRQLWDQLQKKEKLIERANKRIEEAETKVQNMKDRLRQAQYRLDKFQVKL